MEVFDPYPKTSSEFFLGADSTGIASKSEKSRPVESSPKSGVVEVFSF